MARVCPHRLRDQRQAALAVDPRGVIGKAKAQVGEDGDHLVQHRWRRDHGLAGLQQDLEGCACRMRMHTDRWMRVQVVGWAVRRWIEQDDDMKQVVARTMRLQWRALESRKEDNGQLR